MYNAQYYYHNPKCMAINSRDVDCACWCSQGTGPFPDATLYGDDHDGIPKDWRIVKDGVPKYVK